MSKTTISIVIPAYNAGNFITRTLDCLKKQTFRDFECIIINDGSTDDTESVVSEYMGLNPDLTLRLINQENRGIAGARNRGILESNGRYIAFLDHDDIWYPDKLKRCYEIFKQNPRIDLVCHNELMRDSAGRVVRRLHYGPYTSDMFRELLFKRNYLSTSATMVKRDALLDTGLFREEPGFSTVEDFDLWIRLSKRHKFYFIKETLGEYVMDNKSASCSNLERHYNNQIEVVKKNFKEYNERTDSDFYLVNLRISRLYLSLVKDAIKMGRKKKAFGYLLRAFLNIFRGIESFR